MHKRIYLSFFGLMVIFGILISNLGIIVLNDDSSPASQNASTKSKVLSTSRGMIYDCNMKRIVNTSSELLTACLPSIDSLNSVSRHLTENEQAELFDNMSNGEITFLSLPERFNDSFLKTTSIWHRYSENQPCVHLIGHLDENGEGALGLEKSYNNYLKKYCGTLKANWSVDALGNVLLGDGIHFESENYLSPAGIQLTIDIEIQKIAEDVLNNNIQNGAVVILNSHTNEILAMASAPTFNPNDLSSAINNIDSPFINRAITPYSIGSVFKPLIACCALENNISISHSCVGNIDIGGTVFKCSNNKSHGNVNMVSAMEESCNTYFIALGQMLNSEKIIALCSDFGLGKSIEIADNFNIAGGILPKIDTLNSAQSLSNLSFGQGELLASPLQMAVAYSCFANGGFYREPTLMKGIIDETGEIVQKVYLPNKYRIIDESTVSEINEILKSVVNNGNGNKAFSFITENHGKTATAQSGWYENGVEITHTWFCGYFSVDDITYTVVIFKEDGKSGATDCAPLFKIISEEIYKYCVM